MRSSSHQHNVARLRTLLGIKQPEFAQIIGCSLATLQSIEINRLPLSEKIAVSIATETDVSIPWLTNNNLEAEVVAASGKKYVKSHYLIAQGRRYAMEKWVSPSASPSVVVNAISRLLYVYGHVQFKNRAMGLAFNWQLEKMIKGFETEFCPGESLSANVGTFKEMADYIISVMNLTKKHEQDVTTSTKLFEAYEDMVRETLQRMNADRLTLKPEHIGALMTFEYIGNNFAEPGESFNDAVNRFLGAMSAKKIQKAPNQIR